MVTYATSDRAVSHVSHINTDILSLIDLSQALKIQGWMEENELRWLAHMASVSTAVIECGTWKGRSARAMADNTTGNVYVVDNWCDASESSDKRKEEISSRGASAIELEWRNNLEHHLESGKVHLFRGNSPDMAPVVQLATGGVDFAFIDADHAFEGCVNDIRAYWQVVKRGGILAGHDYTTPTHPGVQKAVDLIFGDRAQRGPGSIWWVVR